MCWFTLCERLFCQNYYPLDSCILDRDASGSSDMNRNKCCNDGSITNDLIYRINCLEWVSSELVQWVHFNVLSKWDTTVQNANKKEDMSIMIYCNNYCHCLHRLFCLISFWTCSVDTSKFSLLHMVCLWR